MDYNKQKLIFDQYAEGSIHGVEMVEAMLATIELADLRQYFMVAPLEFDRKLGLDPEPGVDQATRKKDMQQFAVRVLNCAAALLAETFDGFVPTIVSCADGTTMVVEQDVHHIAHLSDPNTLPTTTHILKGAE